jgi:hypothetical protein
MNKSAASPRVEGQVRSGQVGPSTCLKQNSTRINNINAS